LRLFSGKSVAIHQEPAMFKVTKNGANRLDVEVSGKLNRDEMKSALDDLIQKSQGIEHGGIFYRIGELDFPSLGALAIELQRIPQLLRFIRRFDRVAVVSGTGWVRKAGEIEGALMPGLQVKSFDLNQEREAEAWLAG